MRFPLNRLWSSHLICRRFNSNDSSLTKTPGTGKELDAKSTADKPKELTKPKRAFTLLQPETIHKIRRIDDVPINNEMDYVRHRLTEKRKFDDSVAWRETVVLRC